MNNYRERQRLGFSSDDTNTAVGIARARSFGFPVQAHVIVTNDRAFPLNVSELAQRFGDELKKLHPVVHISWFTGIFPNDKDGWFGQGGQLERYLFDLESVHVARRSHDFFIRKNNQLREFLRPHRRRLIDETHRQVTYYSDQFGGAKPYGLSYHLGLHNAKPFYEIFEEAARELQMSYRYAPDRMDVPNKNQVRVHDRFNIHRGVSVGDVKRGLKNIRRVGMDTEIMLHLGDGYGESQFNAFQDERIRNTVRGFLLDMPSSMWRRVEYPESV